MSSDADWPAFAPDFFIFSSYFVTRGGKKRNMIRTDSVAMASSPSSNKTCTPPERGRCFARVYSVSLKPLAFQPFSRAPNDRRPINCALIAMLTASTFWNVPRAARLAALSRAAAEQVEPART
jgi:hypothetical protein